MNIPTEIINDIRNRAPIEDIIGGYIEVIRKGSNYVAYCPFHDDHDPSLRISVDKQIFKCFSCPSEEGSAGDVFKFVMKFKHVDYITAVKIVAETIGYKYDFGDTYTKPVVKETITHKLNNEAINYTSFQLNSEVGKPFKEYLYKRGLDDSVLEKFHFGYNPSNNELYSFLNKKGYKDSDIVEANLGRLTRNGIQDVFFDRITIPIYNEDNLPVGFTARSINPNTESKYINSTDTPVFKKSDVLFNLNNAKEAIREKKFVILAEGPMDVIAFYRAGLKNAVCSLGTSTTKNQLSKIKRVSSKLLLAFDGDNAGQGAILRTGKLAKEIGLNVVVINNETKSDPDEIIKEYGKDKLVSMVNAPKTWLDWLMSYYLTKYDLNNYSEKKEYALKILEEIKDIKDEFDKDNYLEQLSKTTGFSYDLLKKDIPETRNQNKIINITNYIKPKEAIKSGLDFAERTIISQLLYSAKNCDIYSQNIEKLPEKRFDDLARIIVSAYKQKDSLTVAELCSTIDDPSLVDLLIEISEMTYLGENEDSALLNDAIIKIKEYYIDLQIEENERNLKKYTDGHVIGKVAGQLVALKLQKKELQKQLSGNK